MTFGFPQNALSPGKLVKIQNDPRAPGKKFCYINVCLEIFSQNFKIILLIKIKSLFSNGNFDWG